EKLGHTPPAHEVRIVEVNRAGDHDERGRVIILGDAVRMPSDYESRFEELMHSGLPWVNMSCYGVYNGLLIVGIELPNYPGKEGRTRPPSVNYSGPQVNVIQHDWDASQMMVIV